MDGELVVIVWENGEGALVASVGWIISQEAEHTTLASSMERVHNSDFVSTVTAEIPTANIHSIQHLDHARPLEQL